MEQIYPIYFNEKKKDPALMIKPHFIERRIAIHSVIGAIDHAHGRSFSFPGEAHTFWEMVYVVDGKVGITADDRIYTLSAGDLIFHKPMEFHKIWAEDDFVRVNIYTFVAYGTQMRKLENYGGQVGQTAEKQLHELSLMAKQAFVTDEGGLIMELRDPVKAQLFAGQLEAFLLEVRDHTRATGMEDKDSRVFSTVVSYLNDNLYNQLTVEEIAQHCNLSASMLKKIFKKYTDTGVMAYFSCMKIKKAMELLNTGVSVASVSEKLAFSNQFYFSTVFKRQTGYTPTEYKKMGQQSRKE